MKFPSNLNYDGKIIHEIWPLAILCCIIPGFTNVTLVINRLPMGMTFVMALQLTQGQGQLLQLPVNTTREIPCDCKQ